METNVDNYNDNMRRSLTVWAPLDTTVPQMIEALQKIFGDTTNQQVIAIERDSRVRSISKINIILSTEIACEHLSSQGILLKEKRFYPKPTRPRPPPSNRGYLPNFPVAANKSDLEEAAIELGIFVLRIEPREFQNSTIKNRWLDHLGRHRFPNARCVIFRRAGIRHHLERKGQKRQTSQTYYTSH